MKKVNSILLASSFAGALVLSPHLLFAHSENDGGTAMHFDPVDTEFGAYEPDMQPTKTVEMKMDDTMRFTPDEVRVKVGDVVKFTHTNTGKLLHEMVLGTPSSLDEHAEMMKKFPGMEHEEPYMSHVQPGESGQILWKFTQAGEFAFGCLIPGHYDAGMKGKIIVES